MELAQHARQVARRDVEERRVREHAVEVRRGEVEGEEVLVQYLAAGVVSCHVDEARGTVEADGLVPQVPERA